MAEKYNHEFYKVTFPHEYVALVEINRPEKVNAFKEAMWINLEKIFNTLSTDPDVRVVVFTGAGDRGFTSGLDLQAATSGTLHETYPDSARAATHFRRHILEFQRCVTSMETCEKPVISLMHGICFGLAIDLSLATDIRLAATNSRMCIKEVDIGLAADIGTLTRIVHAGVPMSWAKEMALTAREFGAAEAAKVGLVSGVVEGGKQALLQKGLDMAKLIASKSPVAVVGTKELINYSRGRTVDEGLNYTAIWNMAMLQTDDMKQAMVAGLTKKKLTFSKL